ncbi:hypothetical protein DV495_000049 [Geotrichum candidum]|uniref:Aminomethyltransferase n=1 Tax=Geotrichum candidum TaxID=1173061 RepID=A0A0J9XG40_GEOCN|nr:hypothetical protein DV454_000968 [Geotrichum candidum]KAI9215050.1 hypothetical protein DS838_000036 [Geotrichum bryndzae]KAF5121702.1 hypothetical protein DV452_000654 [Geotrichum candidum]KAF5136183.1 hypothetical protein DV495_000049 [Geotrichum candidum]KAF7497910.1 hypothetical protein DV113_004052 [Geotrichum candidum]
MLRTTVSRCKATSTAIARRFNSTTSDGLLKTPFYDLHVELGGNMVGFAGYAMPVLYKGQSHIESHNWTREKAGLFDVSHMLQHKFSGPGTTEFLESITPSDLKSLKPFSSTLSVLLNNQGGIVDDTIISKHGEDDFYVVTNAGCRDKDLKFFADELEKFGKGNVSRTTITGGLLALQGPEAAATLQKLTTDNLSNIKFGESQYISLLGGKYHAARGGYTGEDGFEVSIPDEAVALDFFKKLLDIEAVKPIGLAARDSLRLEAGMCLYGHELNENITPVEAGLTWVIGKSRRTPETATFNGADAILAQIADKSLVKRVRKGIVVKGPAAREQMKVYSADGKELVGEVTSGSFSPTTKQNIGMAYVPRDFKIGSDIKIDVRGKLRDAKIAKMPFVTPNYFRG